MALNGLQHLGSCKQTPCWPSRTSQRAAAIAHPCTCTLLALNAQHPATECCAAPALPLPPPEAGRTSQVSHRVEQANNLILERVWLRPQCVTPQRREPPAICGARGGRRQWGGSAEGGGWTPAGCASTNQQRPRRRAHFSRNLSLLSTASPLTKSSTPCAAGAKGLGGELCWARPLLPSAGQICTCRSVHRDMGAPVRRDQLWARQACRSGCGPVWWRQPANLEDCFHAFHKRRSANRLPSPSPP